MNILSPEQIRAADRLTIEREPIASIRLMERAATALARHFIGEFSDRWPVQVFCGPGNNGGDGLALARLLDGEGYRVTVYRIHGTYSADHRTNFERLKKTGVTVCELTTGDDLPEKPADGVIIDALFGSGLHQPLHGLSEKVAAWINRQSAITVAIDIPSGLFADRPSKGTVVCADHTYTLQVPKLAFMLPQNEPFTGRWKIIDIGLCADALQVETPYRYNTLSDMTRLYRRRARTSHKGSHGHALLVAGSYGKAGAAVLAARAALRSGAGLLTVHVPKKLVSILQTAVPEAMVSPDNSSKAFSNVPDMKPFRAIGVGPGLGTALSSEKAFENLLRSGADPMVIDADGLNLLARHPEWATDLPEYSILTPHPGEFRRLAGTWNDDFERLDLQRRWAQKHRVILVLKGAHTSIALPDGSVSFNSTGNHGMATAGSGDTLTGLITGLLAQGYPPADTARLGVFLHGLAGDLVLSRRHPNALIASDIIEYFGQAFHHLDPCT